VVKDTITYDGWGQITNDTNMSLRGRYGYTGREEDVETGWQYNRARYYDSVNARWITQDPLGFDAGDSNLYRYVLNSSTGASDPGGLTSWVGSLQGWFNGKYGLKLSDTLGWNAEETPPGGIVVLPGGPGLVVGSGKAIASGTITWSPIGKLTNATGTAVKKTKVPTALSMTTSLAPPIDPGSPRGVGSVSSTVCIDAGSPGAKWPIIGVVGARPAVFSEVGRAELTGRRFSPGHYTFRVLVEASLTDFTGNNGPSDSDITFSKEDLTPIVTLKAGNKPVKETVTIDIDVESEDQFAILVCRPHLTNAPAKGGLLLDGTGSTKTKMTLLDITLPDKTKREITPE
jgi:RHS repeat-associated protein